MWKREAPTSANDVPKNESVELLEVEGRQVRVTNPGKPYFTKEVKLTKLDIVRYYLSVAPGALAGIRDRPIVLKRFVNGAEGEAFYQKRAPSDKPDWLRSVTLSFPSGRTAEEVVVDDAEEVLRHALTPVVMNARRAARRGAGAGSGRPPEA